MTRTGKIARLPECIREQINHRLRNGEEGQQIIAWLNSLDEVKQALAPEFENTEITDGNLTMWKQGGYRDWEFKESALEEARRLAREGRELGRTMQQGVADGIGLWLAGRYVATTRKLIENQNDEEAWKLLREMCHDVSMLRRGDHSAQWVRLENERIRMVREREKREQRKQREAENPPKPPMDDEEKERKFREIFGMEPL